MRERETMVCVGEKGGGEEEGMCAQVDGATREGSGEGKSVERRQGETERQRERNESARRGVETREAGSRTE